MSNFVSQKQDFNEEMSNWDVSSVMNTEGMFNGADSFNQSLDKWDVSSVTNMNTLFSRTEVFNKDLDSWNTSSVTSMLGMFDLARAFIGKIGRWDVSSVMDFRYMFRQPIASIRISAIVSSATLMSRKANSYITTCLSCSTSSTRAKSKAQRNCRPISFLYPLRIT